MREHAHGKGIPILLYEAGEALRFDEVSIRAGVRGITGVLRELRMLPLRGRRKPPATPVIAMDSNWVRAPGSGILRASVDLGQRVKKGDVLAVVADPFGAREVEVRTEHAGIVIGRSNLPLTHAGDALYHVARVQGAATVAGHVEAFKTEHEPDTDKLGELDEPPIV
jgi:predicted deacylase